MVPIWLAVVTGLGGLIVSAAITPFVTLRVARSREATTRRGQDLTKSQSDRDLILAAAALARSEDLRSRQQGSAMLNGLVQMEGLSADDAIFVQSLTRPLTEPLLSEAREALARGGTIAFELDTSDSDQDQDGGDGDDQSD